jgi:hypothetical protein
MHGGAPGSGAPKGERNGRFRHGMRTGEAVEQRQAIREYLREVRALLRAI